MPRSRRGVKKIEKVHLKKIKSWGLNPPPSPGGDADRNAHGYEYGSLQGAG